MTEISNHDLTKLVVVALSTIVFLAVGIGCAFHPHAVRKLATKRKFGPILDPAMHITFLRNYIESPRYIFQLRLIGVIALIAAAVGLCDLVLAIHGYFG